MPGDASNPQAAGRRRSDTGQGSGSGRTLGVLASTPLSPTAQQVAAGHTHRRVGRLRPPRSCAVPAEPQATLASLRPGSSQGPQQPAAEKWLIWEGRSRIGATFWLTQQSKQGERETRSWFTVHNILVFISSLNNVIGRNPGLRGNLTPYLWEDTLPKQNRGLRPKCSLIHCGHQW